MYFPPVEYIIQTRILILWCALLGHMGVLYRTDVEKWENVASVGGLLTTDDYLDALPAGLSVYQCPRATN